MREVAYSQRLSESITDAQQQASLLISATTSTGWPDGDAWGQFPYELVSSAGPLGSSSQIKVFETGGHALMPLPAPSPYPVGHIDQSAETFPGAVGGPLAGTSVPVVSDTFAVASIPDISAPTIPNLLRKLPADAQIRAYVFVTDASATAAVDALDRVLYPGLPAAVLLVGAVAYLATRRALRPVEAIRARTAAVTASDPRERVTVPRTGDEIARLAETINETLERLDGAVRTLRGFVADAAHELRSPLATLLATLEVAEAYPDRADWPATVATARRQARRVQLLTEDLLLLARLDAQPAGPHADAAPGTAAAEVDLTGLAYDTAADYRVRPGGVTVLCDTTGTGRVLGDPARLERVLRNLLDNAVRHASTRVSVTVHDGCDAGGGAGYVELSVQDDGPGIPAQDRERVFERFTRLDDARSRETGGTGLGLAIAREIVERSGGTLRVAESEAGARLVARIPRARPATAEAAPPPTPEPPAAQSPAVALR